MKKFIVAITAIAAALVVGAVDLIVPKTDSQTLLRSPLDRNSIAFEDLGDNTARLWVGQDGSAIPMQVVNPLSLNGWREREMEKKEYSISFTAGFTYDGTTDKYTFTSTTTGVWERIVFTALGNRVFANVKYTEYNGKGGISGEAATVVKNVTDNQVVLEVMKNYGQETETYYIQAPVCTMLEEGSITETTDLTQLHVSVKDTIGVADLSTWRDWAKHSNDGNLGEDWSKYKATSNVSMLDHKISFGTNETISSVSVGKARDNDNAIEFTSSGTKAMWIGPAPSSEVIPTGAIISNIAFAVTNTTCYITIQAINFPGFDISKMKLLWSDSVVEGNIDFEEVSFTHTGSNPYLIQTPKVGKTGFFVCRYGNTTAYIEVKCPMKVSELRLIGTDDKIYRITVTAGVISATEITE